MEVSFPPEVEARLEQVASRTGRNAEQLVQAAAMQMLEDEARFSAAVKRGIEQADQGKFVEHEEVVRLVKRIFEL